MLDVIAIQPQLWIVPVVGLVVLLIGLLFFWVEVRIQGYGGFKLSGWVATSIAAILGLIWAGMLIPYDSKYHVVFKLSGTVESVTNTLDGGGDGERSLSPVVKLSGYDDPIQMDNPRIVTLKGKEVDLVCTYEWVWQGLDVTNCNIRAIK